MAAKKKQRKGTAGRKIGRAIEKTLLVLLLLAILACGIGAAWYFTGGFGGALPTATVTIRSVTYKNTAKGVAILSGEEIRVNRYFGEKYEVKILSDASENDFTFKIGNEEYKWSDAAGDFTECFTITETEAGFEIGYENLTQIISAKYGADVEIVGKPDGDVFKMYVSCAKNTVEIGFHAAVPVSGIEIDPDHVIFGGGGQ